jgi:hypothetical protein
MNELEFERRLHTAARAAVAGIVVPPMPLAVREATFAKRSPRRRWFAAAVAAGIALAASTDGGRAAIAYAVQHTVSVLGFDAQTAKRLPVSSISLQQALSLPAFHVVEPRGLPSAAQLESIQLLGDAAGGSPSVVFHYAAGRGAVEIVETALRAGSPSRNPTSARRVLRIVSPAESVLSGFNVGRTRIVVSVPAGAAAEGEIEGIRQAMTSP